MAEGMDAPLVFCVEKVWTGQGCPIFGVIMKKSFELRAYQFEVAYRAAKDVIKSKSEWFTDVNATLSFLTACVQKAAVKAVILTPYEIKREDLGIIDTVADVASVDDVEEYIDDLCHYIAEATATAVPAFAEARRLDQLLSGNFNERLYGVMSVW